MRYLFLAALGSFLALLSGVAPSWAVDSETSRETLKGIKGVYVLVEELQPNIKKLSERFTVGKDQLQGAVELRLKQAGIRVLKKDEWIKTPGRPIFYVNVNTHARERYRWAYDIRVELQQIASMEANQVKALISSWSTNITGTLSAGTLSILKDETLALTDIFIKAFFAANPSRP